VTPLILAALLLGLDLEGAVDAVPMCFASDVKALCCPGACVAKIGPKWTQANEILRGCMKGLGCADGESKSATVFMKCDCK
jgi:hypothetical protein